MRILLDECLPRELAAEFVGHEVRTASQEGWAGLKPPVEGNLRPFEVFITIDKRIEQDHKIPDNLAIIMHAQSAFRICCRSSRIW